MTVAKTDRNDQNIEYWSVIKLYSVNL